MWYGRCWRRESASRSLVRADSDRRNLDGLDVEIVEADLRDREAVAAAVQGCDTVYHVAARYSSDPADDAELYAVNVGGTRHVMEAALEASVQRVVLTSTIGTIGRPPGTELATEADRFNLWPHASVYVKSKYLAEVAARRLAQQGLPLLIVHPCAPIGTGDIKPTVTGQRIVTYLSGRRPSYLAGASTTSQCRMWRKGTCWPHGEGDWASATSWAIARAIWTKRASSNCWRRSAGKRSRRRLDGAGAGGRWCAVARRRPHPANRSPSPPIRPGLWRSWECRRQGWRMPSDWRWSGSESTAPAMAPQTWRGTGQANQLWQDCDTAYSSS